MCVSIDIVQDWCKISDGALGLKLFSHIYMTEGSLGRDKIPFHIYILLYIMEYTSSLDSNYEMIKRFIIMGSCNYDHYCAQSMALQFECFYGHIHFHQYQIDILV